MLLIMNLKTYLKKGIKLLSQKKRTAENLINLIEKDIIKN